MPDNEVFVDTTALLAIVNRADALHEVAISLRKKLSASRAPLVTSDWVLAEFLSGASVRPLRASAARLVAALGTSSRLTIVEATHGEWQRSFAFFQAYSDKDWSFVDCSSMLICQERGIHDVFTHDHHFSQCGLHVLMKV